MRWEKCKKTTTRAKNVFCSSGKCWRGTNRAEWERADGARSGRAIVSILMKPHQLEVKASNAELLVDSDG